MLFVFYTYVKRKVIITTTFFPFELYALMPTTNGKTAKKKCNKIRRTVSMMQKPSIHPI